MSLRRVCVCLIFALFACGVSAAEIERTGGPYVPTPQVVVDAMLELANVGPRDFVVDLGSGDGRIVLTAAQKYSARGFGVDIDPELVEQSNAEAERRGLATRASFREQDVLQTPISEASVVTLYLLPGMMQSLQTKFLRELKPGTRIVSHDFPFGDWKPDREMQVDVPEKYGTPGQWKSTLFYWIVPAQVHGAWEIRVPALSAQPLPVMLSQQFQYIEGAASAGGRRVPVTEGRLEGERVHFKLAVNGAPYEFSGIVRGDAMQGDAVRAGRSAQWRALRTVAPAAARQ